MQLLYLGVTTRSIMDTNISKYCLCQYVPVPGDIKNNSNCWKAYDGRKIFQDFLQSSPTFYFPDYDLAKAVGGSWGGEV